MAVKVYSTPTCPYCKLVKAFLSENNVSYEDANVADDQNAAREMTDKSGQMGVPVLDIDGEINDDLFDIRRLSMDVEPFSKLEIRDNPPPDI